MNSTPLPWQETLWRKLCLRHARDRLPHAILLHGPEGCGKQHLARALSGLLLCQQAGPDGACGHCRGCQLWEREEACHTDFLALAPEAEGRAIPVDQVRAASHFLEASGRFAAGRVVLIGPAEAMQASAGNALLKTLEEPPANAHLLLVSSMPSLLLATLRSRCEKISVPAPAREQAQLWLESIGHTGTVATQALDLSGGAPLLAARWLDDGELDERRDWFSRLEKLMQGELPATEAVEGWLAGKGNDPARLRELVACLQRWASDDLRKRATQGDGLQARGMTARFRLIEQLGNARRVIQSAANPNPQLLLEDLLLDWQHSQGTV